MIMLKYDRKGGANVNDDHYNAIIRNYTGACMRNPNQNRKTNVDKYQNPKSKLQHPSETTNVPHSQQHINLTFDQPKTNTKNKYKAKVTIIPMQKWGVSCDDLVDPDDMIPDNNYAGQDDPDKDVEILLDMYEGCKEDNEETYYDENGDIILKRRDTLTNQKHSKIPIQGTEIKKEVPSDLSTDNRPLPFIPSLEDSDVEIIPELLLSYDDDPKDIPDEFKHEARPKNRKYARTHLDKHKFLSMEIEDVHQISWTVDGDHHYHIKCEPDDWHERQRDGHWWIMNSSTRKGFNVTRKTGRCQGSFLCENIHCLKLLNEGICNTNEFGQQLGGFVCKCCGYYASKIYCGCVKNTE